jgi:two-component system cell cycle sensor histidine kinase/response regulator CckA
MAPPPPRDPSSDLLPELLRAVIDNLPISIYTKDLQGRYVLNNVRNLRLLGVATEAAVRGKTVFDFFPPEIAGPYADDDRRVLQDGLVVQREEPFVDPVSGRSGWFHTTKIPLRLRDGSGIAGLVGVSRDITAEKMAERQDQQAQRLESLGALSAGVAHDFNNLLTVILGALSVLRQNPAIAPAPLDHIETAAAHAAHLTRQLLTFSRKQVVQPRVVDLHLELPQIRTLLARLMPETIAVDASIDAEVWPIEIDPVQLSQVLINLAINARDAMPQGGRLVIHTSNVDLDADYGRSHPDAVPGPHVRLTVSDTGTGMSPETLGHVFEPFFTTKEVGKGTGLGLATVHGIVRQSGGHLTFHSELGRGTTVHVLLPRVEESATYPAAAPPDAPATAGSETILLIEDEASLREVIADELAYGGYTVLSGATAEEALAAAARHQGPIHLLITDLVMPGIDGREAAIRVRTARPDVRVMYMSGYHPTNVGLEPVDAREAFLQKPFGLDALLRKVREVLDGPASRE